jgi:hypothetical protein
MWENELTQVRGIIVVSALLRDLHLKGDKKTRVSCSEKSTSSFLLLIFALISFCHAKLPLAIFKQ